ncbi:glucosamine-6-phosphate isomerase [Candidatus Calescamantes bacterium]|nr:glucosamine-6-phosphate isomerase [Candidatus Calescamantes bacterium]
MKRCEEVRKLLSMGPEELVEKANGKLVILDTLDELHEHFARTIAEEIKGNNEKGEPTRLILPVGPTGQYPILAEIINKERISLKNCYFFYMDEYCDDTGKAIPPSHPLSFQGEMEHLFFSRIDSELNIPEGQLIFPSHENIHLLKGKIEEVGGIDTCYGGIGIHGHVAFNEPEPNIRYTDPRLVYLNQYTITINAIRSEVGGDLVNFPRKAVTLGMNQICGARRVRLYCRNDIPGIDWANLVLRLAVLGTPGDDYPVTYLTEHPDYVVVTIKNTAERPKNILSLPY